MTLKFMQRVYSLKIFLTNVKGEDSIILYFISYTKDKESSYDHWGACAFQIILFSKHLPRSGIAGSGASPVLFFKGTCSSQWLY